MRVTVVKRPLPLSVRFVLLFSLLGTFAGLWLFAGANPGEAASIGGTGAIGEGTNIARLVFSLKGMTRHNKQTTREIRRGRCQRPPP